MSKDKTPAQTVSFSWVSTRHSLKGLVWAEKPEEVPWLDPSRGQPLVYPLGTDIEEFYSLGGQEPPKHGYPRLVRRGIEFNPYIYQREGEELLSELASLCAYIPAWRAGKPVVKLRRDVLALAEKYGAPYTDEENTLEAWLALATRVHIFMWGRRVLKEEGVEKLIAAANEKLESAESEGTQPVKAEGFSIWDTRPSLRRFYVDLNSGEPRKFRGMIFPPVMIDPMSIRKIWCGARRSKR